MSSLLTNYIRVVDAVLPAEFCAALVQRFEQTAASHYRGGAAMLSTMGDSAWTELNISRLADDAFKGYFLKIIAEQLEAYNDQVALPKKLPLRTRYEDLRLKKYRAASSEQFQLHYDNTDAHPMRYLVLLWYLNDVGEGGETFFPALDLRVSPKPGRMLIFPPYWMFQHIGMPPRSNDKYILSTYLLFNEKPLRYSQA